MILKMLSSHSPAAASPIKQPACLAHGCGSDGVFQQVAVDFHTAVSHTDETGKAIGPMHSRSPSDLLARSLLGFEPQHRAVKALNDHQVLLKRIKWRGIDPVWFGWFPKRIPH
jgi:hypothetical protein